ncbi:unnamed protein product, partial [Bubo scandiacus]
MQKPFPELINEPGGRRGGGKAGSPARIPTTNTRGAGRGVLLGARLCPYRLRPRGLPSGCPQLRAAGTSAGGAERSG